MISVGGKKTSQALLILQGTLPRFIIESNVKLQLEVREKNVQARVKGPKLTQ